MQIKIYSQEIANMRIIKKTGFATGANACRVRTIEAGRFIAHPA
jgi:hypothetical protein